MKEIKLSTYSMINSIWNCTTKQFDVLLLCVFFWTINKLLRIWFRQTDEEVTLFIQLEHVRNSVSHLNLLISLSQMSSPVRKYVHYLIDWKEFLSVLSKAKFVRRSCNVEDLRHVTISPFGCPCLGCPGPLPVFSPPSLCTPLIVLKTSNTRWSARCDAVHALGTSYRQISFTLHNISNDNAETGQTCFWASSLAALITMFELAVLCILWDRVLWQFNVAVKTLQKESCYISTVVDCIPVCRIMGNRWEMTVIQLRKVKILRQSHAWRQTRNKAEAFFAGRYRKLLKMMITDISLLVTTFELIPLRLF